MKVQVLGTGCANCKRTLQVIEDTARQLGVSIELSKVEDMAQIVAFGVMSTPSVVIDGQVVHAGGIPAREKVQRWLLGDDSTAAGAGVAGASATR